MGNVQLTHEELEAMLDRAAKRGARAALQEMGLHDENAARDMEDVRQLLSSWRETRTAVWATVVKLVTTATLVFIAGAVWLAIKANVVGDVR